MTVIPGGTSTGSKSPAALFGDRAAPRRMVRAEGVRVWDAEGREYLDCTMALGAVALGYGHPKVVAAARTAAEQGIVGPLPPVHEEQLAERLLSWAPGAEQVRFLKTGAEAVAAAVRIARTHTGRDAVVTCGYHGWLDWCQDTAGVPEPVKRARRAVPFNDVAAVERAVTDGTPPAAIVVEPVVDGPPAAAWLDAVRDAADRAGAVLVFDEIKTGVRFGKGGAAARYGGRPDLVVLGKALGNGFPIAAVLGPRDLMRAAEQTWISSTLATEYVALAAASAVLEVCAEADVPALITQRGERLLRGLERLVPRYPDLVTGVRGVPEFCYLTFVNDGIAAAVAAAAAANGLLFKRDAYNFIALPHDDPVVDEALDRLDAALGSLTATC